jgi:hypothetical protein
MKKLKIIEHISLDGVIQHSADDDDFPYRDWIAPYRTPGGRDATLAAHGESFDLLLGVVIEIPPARPPAALLFDGRTPAE